MKQRNVIIFPNEYSPCTLKQFRIGNKNASLLDFGKVQDARARGEIVYDDDAWCCCVDCRFVKKDYDKSITKKYKIDEQEYNRICKLLDQELIKGNCNYCD